VPEDLAAKLRSFNPRSEMGRYVRECLHFLPVQMAAELIDRVSRTLVLESSLSIMTRVWDDLQGAYVWRDHGLVCQKVVTTAGVNFLVDAWQNSVELEIMKYHGLGTGSTAEGSGDTALVTELTTEYTGDVRATGSLTEGATANVFRTVGTNTLDGTPGAALREHGIFSASTVGTLWDRSVFASITLSSGESLQSQYDLTASAGG
jgi:hypothetical protein